QIAAGEIARQPRIEREGFGKVGLRNPPIRLSSARGAEKTELRRSRRAAGRVAVEQHRITVDPQDITVPIGREIGPRTRDCFGAVGDANGPWLVWDKISHASSSSSCAARRAAIVSLACLCRPDHPATRVGHATLTALM